MLSCNNTRLHIYRTRKNKVLHHQTVTSAYPNCFKYCAGFSARNDYKCLSNNQAFSGTRGIGYTAVAQRELNAAVFISQWGLKKKGMVKNLERSQGSVPRIKDLVKELGACGPCVAHKTLFLNTNRKGLTQMAKESQKLTIKSKGTHNDMLSLSAQENRWLIYFKKEATVKSLIIRKRRHACYRTQLGLSSQLHPHIYKKLKNVPPFLLKGLVSKVLKDNSRFIKQVRPYLYSDLKGSSTTAGFQKTLYNKVSMQGGRLLPGTNRRKHSHSHYLIIKNQFRRINKTFHYIGKQSISNIVAFALKMAYCFKPAKYTCSIFNSAPLPGLRAIPGLISAIETQLSIMLWRNQFRYHLTSSRRALLHKNTRQGDAICALCLSLKESTRPRK